MILPLLYDHIFCDEPPNSMAFLSRVFFCVCRWLDGFGVQTGSVAHTLNGEPVHWPRLLSQQAGDLISRFPAFVCSILVEANFWEPNLVNRSFTTSTSEEQRRCMCSVAAPWPTPLLQLFCLLSDSAFYHVDVGKRGS